MKKLFLLVVLLTLFLGACGVPQKEHDAEIDQISEDYGVAIDQISAYEAELEHMTSQRQLIEAELDASVVSLSELQGLYDDLDKEYRDLNRTTESTIQALRTQLKSYVCEQQLPDMRYESIMDVSTILQAFISGQEDTLRVQGTYRDTIWNNTTTKIHSVNYRSKRDSESYVDHFLVYFVEFGWDEGVFWLGGQCWLDQPE